MKFLTCLFSFSMIGAPLAAQDSNTATEASVHYERVPDYPSTFTAGTALARVVDGLGFRYYWVTKDLTPKDLEYRPSEEARSSLETLSHLEYMVTFMENTMYNKVTSFPEPEIYRTYAELRAVTLDKIKAISDKLLTMDSKSLSELQMKLKVGEDDMAVPIWHMLQGPVGDAYYHLGQLVSFRRTMGNPIDPKVQPFMGKRMD